MCYISLIGECLLTDHVRSVDWKLTYTHFLNEPQCYDIVVIERLRKERRSRKGGREQAKKKIHKSQREGVEVNGYVD